MVVAGRGHLLKRDSLDFGTAFFCPLQERPCASHT